MFDGTFAIVNQKGGVGKTTTALNLATSLATLGKKVLLVDFDPQGNASTGLGLTALQKKTGVYDSLFHPAKTSLYCQQTAFPSLHILPSSQDLSGAEVELVSVKKRHCYLASALFHVKHHYDYIFIDCPPSLGLLTLNALGASKHVLVPLQCEFYALEGLSHLLDTLKMVKKNLNPAIELHGIVFTMYDQRSALNRQVVEDVKKHLGSKVYSVVVPRNIKVAESPSFGQPVIVYAFHSKGAQAYLALAKEFMEKNEPTHPQ